MVFALDHPQQPTTTERVISALCSGEGRNRLNLYWLEGHLPILRQTQNTTTGTRPEESRVTGL